MISAPFFGAFARIEMIQVRKPLRRCIIQRNGGNIFVFFLFFLFRGLFWGWGGWGWRGYSMYGGYHDGAAEILRRRYASGEITKDQFDQMMRDIEQSHAPRP